jgi:hypothetical protein
MTAKARKGAGNSAVSYIADLTTELAAIAAAEGHRSLAQILRMAHREAQGLCGGGTGPSSPPPPAERPGRMH